MELLEGTVPAPGGHKIQKKYLVIPAGVALAYVTYRWYQTNQAQAAAPAASDGLYSNPDLTDMGLSTTGGATNVTGNTGSTTTDGTTTGAIDDNAKWTNKAVELLSDSGYDPMTVRSALGEFIARRSLDKTEAGIARAAIAAVGEPPVGRPWSVQEEATTGTGTLAAPTGLKASSITSTSVTISFNPVAGAGYYRAYRSGASTNVGSTDAANHSITITGLSPNTSYSFQVAADTTLGKPGPKSSAVTAKTAAVKLGKPSGLHSSAITKTSFRVTCGKVAGATYYRWYVNGKPSGASDQPYRDFTGMHPNTTYRITVAADTSTQTPGPGSSALSVKTKK